MRNPIQKNPALIFLFLVIGSTIASAQEFKGWGSWSLGWKMGSANVDNLYSFSSDVDFSNPVTADVKFSCPGLYFKVENITSFIYWNMELALPLNKAVTLKGQTDPVFDSFEGKARFGRMINVPVAVGGFITERLGFWGGYNFSLFYLSSTESAFTGNSGAYNYTERFRAGDVGILNGSGVSLHSMVQIGEKSLLRVSVAATKAGNKKFDVKGSSTAAEINYFIAFDEDNLSRGIRFRLETTNVKCKAHPSIGRFNDEPTVAKSTAFGIEFCFGL